MSPGIDQNTKGDIGGFDGSLYRKRVRRQSLP
jgi:hypothetical protein